MHRCPHCGYLADLDPDPLDVTPRDSMPALHPEDDAATWYLTVAGILLVVVVVLVAARVPGA
jgi:hypothetical protein